MSFTSWLRLLRSALQGRSTARKGRRAARFRPARFRPEVEALEDRSLPSGLSLTPLVQVSGASPLGPNLPPGGTVSIGSEVEPHLAVDPSNPAHAVAVWQQDRYTGSGARAIVFSVSNNANARRGATWSAPTAIPGLDASIANPAYQRYSDPWVAFAPNGEVYVSALAISFSAGFPSTTAILVTKSTNGGHTWDTPQTLIDTPVPPGTNPIELLNDKEAITADPTQPGYVYVVWDRLNLPSDSSDVNAFNSFAFRGDTLFARSTNGGNTWEPYQVLFAPQANVQTIGHQIVVLPDGTLVDSFTILNGSGNQPTQAAQNSLAVMRSSDKGLTWSQPIIVGSMQPLAVTDPDTGAPVRTGEIIADFAVDPNNGNLYLVWSDARFSNFKHNDVAFSMSSDGGLTWSTPIKINQAGAALVGGNQQAFVPSVAVAANGTVAVTYYDFRNNNPAAGVPTDYWLVHASANFTSPASWTSDEKRLTDTSFNLEVAPLSRGYFLGDYMGLAAAGNNFYALFVQAGTSTSDRSNVWFRDPPPAPDTAAAPHLAGDAVAAQPLSRHLGAEDLAGDIAALLGESWETIGRAQTTEDVGRFAYSSPTAIRRSDQGAAVVPSSGQTRLVLRSGGFGETTALDEAFAGLSDNPFADPLAGDAVSPLAG